MEKLSRTELEWTIIAICDAIESLKARRNDLDPSNHLLGTLITLRIDGLTAVSEKLRTTLLSGAKRISVE